MKYIKFGFGAIAAQTINANCCRENKKNKAIKEACKYFGIQEENIISSTDYADNNKFGLNVRREKKIKELIAKDVKLKQWGILKGNPKSGKLITVHAMSKKLTPDSNYIKEITEDEYKTICANNENKDIYITHGIGFEDKKNTT